jgi:DNA-binding transcriptional regulator GbsR (MarR family)
MAVTAQEQVGELALKCWDTLFANFKAHLGPMTATELMLSTGMGRAEIAYGLRELAANGWAKRDVTERDGRMIEMWACVERQQQRRGQQLEAAE